VWEGSKVGVQFMTNNYNEAQLQEGVFTLLREQRAERDVKHLIARVTGFKDTKCRELFHELKDAFAQTEEPVTAVAVPEVLEQTDKYTYNRELDQYVVFLRAAGKDIVVPGQRHREMLQAYSNWNGSELSINEICRSFSLPKAWFDEYKAIMGWTHDHEPVTAEELADRPVEDIVGDLLQQKRFALNQEFQKRDWKQTG
jgi:hypothetical protein